MPSVKELYKNKQLLTFNRNSVLTDAKQYLSDCTKNTDAPYLLEFIVTSSCTQFTVKYLSRQQYLRATQIHGHVQPDHVYEIIYHNPMRTTPDDKILTGYHGSSMENFYSILTNSLQNYSNTEQMKNGNAFGEGIYSCEDLRVARDFSSGGVVGWKKSTTLGHELSCVVQCIIRSSDDDQVVCKIGKEKNKYIVVKNSERIRIQYLLVYCQVSDAQTHEKREKSSSMVVLMYGFILLVVIMMRFYTDIRREVLMLYNKYK